jgi:hypothetical protein
VYDRLKLTAQMILPGLGALYFGLAQIWGFPHSEEINGSIATVNLFVGIVVAWLKSLHNAAGTQYDGVLSWEDHDDGTALKLKQIDLAALENKGEILLKVTRPDPPPSPPPAE